MKKILVLNSGSSSLKYQLIALPKCTVLAKGMVEKIGSPKAGLVYKSQAHSYVENKPIKNHSDGLRWVVDQLMDPKNGVVSTPSEIDAIGHRVVHGGSTFKKTTLINEAVKDKIKALYSLAPLHNPPNMEGIEISEELFKGVPQVAVFDTAFHQTLEEKSYRFPIDKELADKENIRTYGFHGTSHEFVSKKTAAYLKNESAKLVILHLGNGCSATAVEAGKSVEHSMGFGPINGLMMGTRSGDIDPAVLLYLQESLQYSVADIKELLTKNSGMQGIAGASDLREIWAMADRGDSNAQLALEMNAHRVKKFIGSLFAVLNGAHAVVFTAGIGENDWRLREKICSNLEGLGIELDTAKNKKGGTDIFEIQSKNSKVKILVVPTDEELEIALQTHALITA